MGDDAMEISADDVEPFKVENVADIGNGEPLFANFSYEDWQLLSIAYELHLLVHAFRKALDDPDRLSFPEAHLSFYYDKVFRKSFSLKNYGMQKFSELNDYIKDTIKVKDDGYLDTPLDDSTARTYFVQLTEEHRRERERRVDAGDETARLKFPSAQAQAQGQQRPSPLQPAGKGAVGPSSAAKRPLPITSLPHKGDGKKARTVYNYGAPPAQKGAYGAYGGPRPVYKGGAYH